MMPDLRKTGGHEPGAYTLIYTNKTLLRFARIRLKSDFMKTLNAEARRMEKTYYPYLFITLIFLPLASAFIKATPLLVHYERAQVCMTP